MWRRATKYGNRKVTVNGITYDSKKEARRAQELEALQAAGEIYGLERQFAFELIPAQREPDRTGPKGGKIKGKTLERAVVYIADFMYRDTKTNEMVVEDTKGVRTPEYIIKRKLMLWVYGIKVKEI